MFLTHGFPSSTITPIQDIATIWFSTIERTQRLSIRFREWKLEGFHADYMCKAAIWAKDNNEELTPQVLILNAELGSKQIGQAAQAIRSHAPGVVVVVYQEQTGPQVARRATDLHISSLDNAGSLVEIISTLWKKKNRRCEPAA